MRPRSTQTLVKRLLSSGVQGVDGRLPIKARSESTHTTLTITDPYIVYQSYISQGILQKDESQLRVMKEFQKLYYRIIDYKPPEELSIKLSLLLRKLEIKNHTYSPLNIFKPNPQARKHEIIKHMTDEEELQTLASPQGLLVNGDVGSGKSLLTDIFANSLPHKSKMRWHYNNFILWVFNEMHNIQQERNLIRRNDFKMENEFLLYEIAQKMIDKNTILILDEFVLPDIASANIIKILFTFYFKLGGVLVATSNKLPEELYSNQFHKMKFKNFVNILNTKCVSIDMKSDIDYRKKFASESMDKPNVVIKRNNKNHQIQWENMIKKKVLNIKSSKSLNELGSPECITVYNRKTNIPLSFSNGACYLNFETICKGLTSSSDYITIASKYHTIILDNVPIMTYKMKNEARRFITLLDAIYESKCQFYMRSEIDIDYLFFPDILQKDNLEISNYLKSQNMEIDDRIQVQDEEMFAKTSIAMTNPYRPNTSTYDQSHTEHFEESLTKSNYSNTGAFTGDDEKFAFKRAVSRIKEMVGSDVWRAQNNWVPIDDSMRPWEYQLKTSVRRISPTFDDEKLLDDFLSNTSIKEIKSQLKDELPKNYSNSKRINFRSFNAMIAPVFNNLQHFWSMGQWTNEQSQKIRDTITKSWIRSSIRNK